MLGSVDSLDNEVRRRHDDAHNKLKLVESLRQSAENHEAVGNDTQAKIDRDTADKYEREAEEADKQAGIYEAMIFARRQKAASIDKEIEKLQQDFDRKMSELQDKKKSILG